MTITVSKSPFLLLPLVIQTQVARFLPKEDLADKARVSKAVKLIFENNQVWSEIAKKSNVPISDPKNVKQELKKAKHAKVKNLNIDFIEGDVNSIFGQAKNELLSISDPFEQHKELMKHVQRNNLHACIML